jgi:hypothetical protein
VNLHSSLQLLFFAIKITSTAFLSVSVPNVLTGFRKGDIPQPISDENEECRLTRQTNLLIRIEKHVQGRLGVAVGFGNCEALGTIPVKVSGIDSLNVTWCVTAICCGSEGPLLRNRAIRDQLDAVAAWVTARLVEKTFHRLGRAP